MGPDPAFASSIQKIATEAWKADIDAGIMIKDLDTGEVLFEHNADRSYNPASVTKILTTAAALQALGPGYKFETKVSRAGRLEGGVLKGDLVIRGDGDPSLTLERMWRIASLVKVAGVSEVTGDIVIDDSYFDRVREGSGYDDFDDNRAYTAPVGAVSATWNTVAVAIRPGAKPGAALDVALDPPTSYVTLVNKGTTGAAGTRRRVSVAVDDAKKTLTVSGSMPLYHAEKFYYRPIDDPPRYFATLLKEYMAKGGIRAGENAAVPANPTSLFTFESEPLGVIVRDLNKFSNNFTAEQILKAFGAWRYGAPGNTQKGLDAVAEYLDKNGVPKGSVVMRNGSGLARDNKVSPRTFLAALSAAYDDFEVRGDFVASMGIAGEDGTLAHRMIGTPAEGNVRAKTGTVDGSTCVAGYARAANGHTLAFAILMNGVGGKVRRAVSLQDRVGAAMATWSGKTDASAALPSKPPETATP
jgi:D-alanyl-D-alanine carboxypeptidase/D-alanyl-D-alanine-endopeptidase (penicillin-binding protein 4)